MDHDQEPPTERKETEDGRKRKKEKERNVTNLDAVKRLIHKWGRPGISSGGGIMRVRTHGAGCTGVYRWNADAPKRRKARYSADRLCPTETNRLPVGAPWSNWIRGWWPTLLTARRYVVYDRVAQVSRKNARPRVLSIISVIPRFIGRGRLFSRIGGIRIHGKVIPAGAIWTHFTMPNIIG